MSEYELRLRGKTERYIVKRRYKSGDAIKYAVSITRYQDGRVAEIAIDDTVISPAHLDIVKFLQMKGLLK